MIRTSMNKLKKRGSWLWAFVALGAFTAETHADHTDFPDAVTIAGSLQEELGCSGDWQPDCADTWLSYDPDDDLWQGLFSVPAGEWEYKAPINNSWDENYGLGAALNGANIPLSLDASRDVKFYYSHETHWVTDNVNSIIATAAGSFQDELGCPGDWQPWCLRSWLQDGDGDGILTFETSRLPAGNYEVKVAHDESWEENYGAEGVPGGPNIPFSVPSDCSPTIFSYDPDTHLLDIGAGSSGVVQPDFVTVAGSFQEELGCPGDWQPDCADTHLAFDTEDTVWQGVFNIPAGDWEYKAPINNSWDENYGANAALNGPNIPLSLEASADVKFYFSRDTNWITDNVNSVIATLAGSFQEELGCSGDWQPWCLRSWLQDGDGDGIYTFSTYDIPAGDYEVKIAHDEDWAENYGADGARDGANIPFRVNAPCIEIFFAYDPASHLLTISEGGAAGPSGNLNLFQAHWVDEDTLAWNSSQARSAANVELHYSADSELMLGLEGLTGGTALSLTPYAAGFSDEVKAKFPHLAGYAAYKLEEGALAMVGELVKYQLAVSASDADGEIVDATSVQLPGVLDDLFTYRGDLGVVMEGGIPTLKLWAPTARSVHLQLFSAPDLSTPDLLVPMEVDPNTGVWSVTGTAAWYGRYYLYEVEVYVPTLGRVETNVVTDPYSLSLAADSARSQIVDLSDPALLPEGWSEVAKPPVTTPEDIVLYELHVRDFSANDPTVPEAHRGTFLAFTDSGARGMQHLADLARAGLTHVHLLPAFDIATVPERREDQVSPDPELLASFAPDSEEQQALITATEDEDAYNWGYDPWHYTVPEGSYSTDPDGPTRVREFREMVKAMNENGLRVVMDVVYNHTNSATQNAKSVLDKVVPGYYHRRNQNGDIETSTCCPNTATEHNMMEKLMLDSILTWVKSYKVDGFRFDLMGHHTKANLLKVRQAIDQLTLVEDGVDGPSVYLYGEGWNFGEVANNTRFEQATQANMAGTGIGSFNDRIRDAARGGGPFSGLQEQGFITGLYYDPNETDQGSSDDQLGKLLLHQDQIRVSLAANLMDFELVDRFGNRVRGSDIEYNGQPAGYTLDPQEIIHYVAVHDNETLFDAIQLKMPRETSIGERVRAQQMGLSLIMLAQGIPIFHAGQDLLRSKSMDRDSFNSGDWFNRLDWSYQINNWGGGLPVASKNVENWPIMRELLGDPDLAAGPDDIKSTAAHFQELLRIRKSSRLFRLTTGKQVRNHVEFLNTGPGQLPGLIVMSISDPSGLIDPGQEQAVILFNSNDEAQSFAQASLIGAGLDLHPVQQDSADPVVRTASFNGVTGTFIVPGRTTAVFVGKTAPGPCVPDATTLCLGPDGRFEARVIWSDFDGDTGSGKVIDLDRRDTGLFYFFDGDTVEMHVNIIDACDVSSYNSFWVYAAASTDVEYTLTVTDIPSGEVRTYKNGLGEAAAPILDAGAFKTCP